MKRDYAEIREEAERILAHRRPDLAQCSRKNPVGEAILAMVAAIGAIMLFALVAGVSIRENELAVTISALCVAAMRYFYLDRLQTKYFSELYREIEILEGSNP